VPKPESDRAPVVIQGGRLVLPLVVLEPSRDPNNIVILDVYYYTA
jgi:hypothetical protein